MEPPRTSHKSQCPFTSIKTYKSLSLRLLLEPSEFSYVSKFFLETLWAMCVSWGKIFRKCWDFAQASPTPSPRQYFSRQANKQTKKAVNKTENHQRVCSPKYWILKLLHNKPHMTYSSENSTKCPLPFFKYTAAKSKCFTANPIFSPHFSGCELVSCLHYGTNTDAGLLTM